MMGADTASVMIVCRDGPGKIGQEYQPSYRSIEEIMVMKRITLHYH